ncbi:MAG: PsiF family protein [Xanthobacteraceae bacterium]
MLRVVFPALMLLLATGAAPTMALTTEEKMETCKFGADNQKLTGGARKKFLSRCMADTDTPAKRTNGQQHKKTS